MADDWLRSVQKDLVTAECEDAEKIRFTAHLLEGPAAQWWETYQITHPLDTLTWEDFKEGFRNAHISTGVMNLKQEEFRNLRQGNRSLKEYMDDFHQAEDGIEILRSDWSSDVCSSDLQVLQADVR